MQVASKHARALPADLDYYSIQTLSMEGREKLTKVRWARALRWALRASCAAPCRFVIPAPRKLTLHSPPPLARVFYPQFQPATIGQATRIGGVSPADVTALLLHLELEARQRRRAEQAAEGGADGAEAGGRRPPGGGRAAGGPAAAGSSDAVAPAGRR